jgi:hypothetical protein
MARLGWILVTMMATLAAGCGDEGRTQEEATTWCDQDRAAKAATVTEASYDQCLSCQQSCGDSCHAQATSPETYKCADDE